MIEVGKRVKCTKHRGAHTGLVVYRLTEDEWGVAWDYQAELRALNERAWESSFNALVAQDGWGRTPTANIEEA